MKKHVLLFLLLSSTITIVVADGSLSQKKDTTMSHIQDSDCYWKIEVHYDSTSSIDRDYWKYCNCILDTTYVTRNGEIVDTVFFIKK